jgi:hypothetical protein
VLGRLSLSLVSYLSLHLLDERPLPYISMIIFCLINERTSSTRLELMKLGEPKQDPSPPYFRELSCKSDIIKPKASCYHHAASQQGAEQLQAEALDVTALSLVLLQKEEATKAAQGRGTKGYNLGMTRAQSISASHGQRGAICHLAHLLPLRGRSPRNCCRVRTRKKHSGICDMRQPNQSIVDMSLSSSSHPIRPWFHSDVTRIPIRPVPLQLALDGITRCLRKDKSPPQLGVSQRGWPGADETCSFLFIYNIPD